MLEVCLGLGLADRNDECWSGFMCFRVRFHFLPLNVLILGFRVGLGFRVWFNCWSHFSLWECLQVVRCKGDRMILWGDMRDWEKEYHRHGRWKGARRCFYGDHVHGHSRHGLHGHAIERWKQCRYVLLLEAPSRFVLFMFCIPSLGCRHFQP